ncbi:MAG: cobalt-precorrin-5B (C(1))-methyltransferase, partial [Desulfovibrio sp.]|nr:cobalt-precorrin-5B (C(1))-methyltransferase [Desulfovibrio sp.]
MAALREGVSTGTCAAAAAMAAVELAAFGDLPPLALAPLPPFKAGKPASFLPVPIDSGALRPAAANTPPGLDYPLARANVVKDGGDDPDATHGAAISATLRQVLDPSLAKPNAGRRGDLFLYGGEGVGVATRSGLPIAVGEAAIN